MRSVPARVVVEPQLPLGEAQRIVFVASGRCSEHSSRQGLSLLCRDHSDLEPQGILYTLLYVFIPCG